MMRDLTANNNMSVFFQAEDGIRDVAVTGVQTCALPICPHARVIESLDELADTATIDVIINLAGERDRKSVV